MSYSIFSFVNMANLCPFLSLQRLTTLIFDKAVLEPTFCPMYAQLCFDIRDKMPRFPPSEPMTDKISFKSVLLNTCQKVFEGTDELSEEIRKMNAPDQKAEREDEVRLLNLRTLGNLRLVGELFLKRMLTETIVFSIVQLLEDAEQMCPSEENIIAICLFLNTVGKKLDESRFNSKRIDKFLRHLKNLSDHPQLDMRIRLMVGKIIHLHSNHWGPSAKKLF
ncbi:putative MIF4G-like, type 3, MIF4G-like domain superfamily protein [Arabidopsis thaliana]